MTTISPNHNDLSETFGGSCKETGEPMVDLNQLDSTLTGCVPESVATELFTGERSPDEFRLG